MTAGAANTFLTDCICRIAGQDAVRIFGTCTAGVGKHVAYMTCDGIRHNATMNTLNAIALLAAIGVDVADSPVTAFYQVVAVCAEVVAA